MTEEEVRELVRLRTVLAGHRWPWEPLGVLLGELLVGSARAQAARLGVDDRQVYRWRRDGLTDAMADRCAIRVGYHPREVWPDWDTVVEHVLVDVA